MATTKQTPKQAAFHFFLTHAGYSYDPKTETPAQGRSRYARQLAKAERDAKALGYTFEWSDDWTCGSHKIFYGKGSAYENSEPETCEVCVCLDPNGDVVASLSCIDDASREYRRVIEAELALEALGNK